MLVLNFKQNYQNIVVFKSGFSTLGNIVYFENKGEFLTKNHSVYNKLQQNNLFSKILLQKKTFIVWRDPYDRIMSLYKDLITNRYGHDGFLSGTNLSYDNIENQKDEFIQKCLKMDDAHTYSIIKQISFKHHKIDCIVPLNKLDKFIREELKHDYYIPNNISNKDIDVSYFEKYRDIIKEVYKEDYELLNINKDIIYK